MRGSWDDMGDLDGMDDPDAVTPSLGMVLEQGRGSLPYALLHGEALVACAAWALGQAGVASIDLGTGWTDLADAGQAIVLHDPLCPMTPSPFIAQCVDRAVELGRIVVGVRPVTDTVKLVDGDLVGAGVDREALRTVASPIVLPAAVVAALDGLPDTDFPRLVGVLADRFPVELLLAPPEARRVHGVDDVGVLQALTARPRPLGP